MVDNEISHKLKKSAIISGLASFPASYAEVVKSLETKLNPAKTTTINYCNLELFM